MRTGLAPLFSLLVRAVAALGADSRSEAKPAGGNPNIIVVLADDLGYRGSKIRPPNIDTLANTGVRLESYYTKQQKVSE